MKEGHGPAPIHMAVILVIILATNSHLQSTCCTPVVNILFYHMRWCFSNLAVSLIPGFRDKNYFHPGVSGKSRDVLLYINNNM